MNEKYDLFISTLNLVVLPFKEIDVSYLVSVQNQIEELEGDYYTFLHKNMILELLANGYLENETVDTVENIRSRISKIDPLYWKAESFINHSEWKDVRDLVINLLKTLK